MNAVELQALFAKGAAAPLDKLSLGDINKVGRAVEQALVKLSQITQKETAHELLLSIRPEDRALFDVIRKAEEKRTPDKLAALRSAREMCAHLADQLRPVLESIRRAPEEEDAMVLIQSLSKEQLNWISLLANVSDADGKLIKYSTKNRAAWLDGLGIKVSGVALAKRKKRR